MEMRFLANFLVVVEQESISTAATIIRVAQPALSRQLNSLEEHFGAQLLVRHSWGVTPTDAGQLLARHARKILQHMAHAGEEIQSISGEPQGDLSVGMPTALAAGIFPIFAELASEQLPNVRFRLVEAAPYSLHRSLTDRELDLAIVYEEPGKTAELVQRRIIQEPIVVVGPAGEFDYDHAVPLDSLGNHALLMPSTRDRLRGLFESATMRRGVHYPVSLEVDSVPTLLEMVAAGKGITIVPFSALYVSLAISDLSYAPLSPNLSRPLMLARRNDRAETAAIMIAAELLEQSIDILRERTGRAKGIEDNPHLNFNDAWPIGKSNSLRSASREP